MKMTGAGSIANRGFPQDLHRPWVGGSVTYISHVGKCRAFFPLLTLNFVRYFRNFERQLKQSEGRCYSACDLYVTTLWPVRIIGSHTEGATQLR